MTEFTASRFPAKLTILLCDFGANVSFTDNVHMKKLLN